MSQRRILMMGKFNQESFKLKEILARHLKHEVYWIRTPQQAIQTLKSDLNFHAVIINTELFTKKKLDLVRNLRAVGCLSPVIYLADVVKDFQSIPESYKTLAVDKPVTSQELDGMIDRVLNHDNFHMRFHKRFSTSELAQLEMFKDCQKFKAKVRNLSLGGAFLESGDGFQTGELLKISIQLESLGKSHELSGKIVWTQRNGNSGLGVKFMRPQEIAQASIMDQST